MTIHNKKILLLGGAGYIGSVLTSHLLDKSYNVTNIDNLIYDNFFSIKNFIDDPNYSFVNINISSNKIDTNFLNKFSSIIILSGLVGDPITKKYNRLAKEYNENYIKKFILECNKSKIEKLVFISTCSNYGLIKNDIPADENYNLNPLSDYAKSKIHIEKFIEENSIKNNFQSTILRFSTAFGWSTRMRFDLTISHFTKDAFFNNFLKVYDKDTWRPYCHVKDFSNLIEIIIKNNSNYKFEIFNAGGDKNNYTKKIIAETILKYLPKIKIEYHDGDIDPRNYKVNFEKVHNFFNFKPKFDLNYGIKELINVFNQKNFTLNNNPVNKNFYGNYNLDHIVN